MPQPVQASSYTFRNIITGGYLYVDKTSYLYELIRHPVGIYFLSRPRRFGKSLMISTLQEIFEGDKEIFQGLAIYESDYDWQPYPVIRIDFSSESIDSAAQLQDVLSVFCREIATQYDITLEDAPYQRQFRWLIQRLAQQNAAARGKVVILIDEYDKPILDNIDDLEEAKRIRDVLRGFYGVIKAMDEHLRFVFITGISKFSKVGVFSTMNNLDDLTMDRRFASAFGITEAELQRDFQAHIAAFAQQEAITPQELLQRIRELHQKRMHHMAWGAVVATLVTTLFAVVACGYLDQFRSGWLHSWYVLIVYAGGALSLLMATSLAHGNRIPSLQDRWGLLLLTSIVVQMMTIHPLWMM